ncbi:MAG: dipeptide ABC transporter ATP-binding protein [Nitrospinaceae bacterium]|nr:dipeptide ABC transporter ATP-binding protein [Nitrospinaceae bacterium]
MASSVKKSDPVLLQARNLKKYFSAESSNYSRSSQTVRALDGVSFTLREGETLGLVGESGCGKSTAARTVLRLTEPTAGEVYFRGQNLFALSHNDLRPLRKEMQIIFQDPYASLNPRKRVRDILEEPFDIHRFVDGKERNERVAWLMERVGLSADQGEKYPHEFSGGQLQRVGIARAIALHPRLVVADEPVSALDVSIRAQVINLLLDLKESMAISYLFISHDMAVVRHFCDRIAVMYLGKIVELANSTQLYSTPQHPYTEALLQAIPRMDPGSKKQRLKVRGDLPNAIDPPKGCAFQTRCPISEKQCEESIPPLKEIGSGHHAACFLRN